MTLKTQMIQTLIDRDFDGCKKLAPKLRNLDMKRFNEYCELRDRSRLINLIDSTVVIDSIPEEMQNTLQRGVDTVIAHMCDEAKNYYTTHDFEPTPAVVKTMREVVANFYGVSA